MNKFVMLSFILLALCAIGLGAFALEKSSDLQYRLAIKLKESPFLISDIYNEYYNDKLA